MASWFQYVVLLWLLLFYLSVGATDVADVARTMDGGTEKNATKNNIMHHHRSSGGAFLDTTFEFLHTEQLANVTRNGNVDIINNYPNGTTITPTTTTRIGICHVAIFLARSSSWILDAREVSAAALLAMTMLNNGDGSVVQEIQGLNETCPVRFTAENVDTGLSPSLATQRLLDLLDRDQGEKQICAMLGPQRSAVALPMAIIGGLQGVPQIGHSARTTDLDDKSQYPNFGRVNPSQEGDATIFLMYLKTLGVKHLGLIHWNDAFGNDFSRSLLQTSATLYPELTIVAVDLDSQQPNYKEAIGIMKKTDFRYFLCFFLGPRDFLPTMTEAAEQGIAGTGEHTWIFSAAVSFGVVRRLVVERNSSLAAAVNGVGIYGHIAGRPQQGMFVYEKFKTAWEALGENEEDIAYLETKRTEGEFRNYTRNEMFGSFADDNAAHMFDAAVLLGLAACRAMAPVRSNNTTSSSFFDGQALFDAMLNTTFQGATGRVQLDPTTGTRLPFTAMYNLANYVTKDMNETHVGFEERESQLFVRGEWTTQVPYVYNDGTTDVPPDLPGYQTDYNYIGRGLRTAGLCMAAVVWLLAIGFASWTIVRRKDYVVRASQPIFLLILCAGTFIMSAAIIPLSIDDGVSSEDRCDIACMVIPWLASTGFVMTFAALFSKTWRVNRIFNNPTLQRIKVTVFDVMKPLLLLLGLNIAVLSVWTAVSPLTWHREITGEDVFDRPIESHGYCYSEDYLPFVILLVGIDLGALLFASYQSYLARGVSTEFAESVYVGRAIACMLLVSFVGVPTMIIVSDEPRARFFVLSSILFVLCSSVLLFIFVPKIMFAKSNTDDKYTLRQSVATAAARLRRRRRAGRSQQSESASTTKTGSVSAPTTNNTRARLKIKSRSCSSPRGVTTTNASNTDEKTTTPAKRNFFDAETPSGASTKPSFVSNDSVAAFMDEMVRSSSEVGQPAAQEGIKVFNTQQKLASLEEENVELHAQVELLQTEVSTLHMQSDRFRQRVSELEEALLSSTSGD